MAWSFGHLDLDVIKKNNKLWNSLETFISTKALMKNFNNLSISQITYGFSKAQKGSEEFWTELSESYLDRAGQIDRLGLAIIVNSFGRATQANLNPLLKAFLPSIMKQMSCLNTKEILLILSGIAISITTK